MQKSYLIKNADIWTADRKNPWADCILIKGKKIEYVGEYDDSLCTEGIKVVDAEGKMMIPAFIDSHIHVGATAKTMWCFLLEQRKYSSIDEIMGIVKAYAEEHPKEEVPYIYAYSCPTHLMDVDYADRYFMDRYISDRPVLLCDENYHRCLVNSKMLELMEIDENVPYDETTSCNYLRFEDNIPNGIIEERAHEFHHDIDKMFDKLGWYPPSEADPQVLAPILDIMTDFGICGVLDGFTESEDTFIGLKALEEQGKLNHYFHAMPLMNSFDDLEDTLKTAKEWSSKYADEYICVDTIKYFLDGTNELGTGAVLEPFVGEPDNFGVLNMSEEKLTLCFERLNQEHINIQIHLVGDRAFRTALDAVERAKKREGEKGRSFDIRVTLLHCELTHPADRGRAAEPGVYINFTPIWAAGLFGDASKQYLGEERFNSMYAFNEMIEAGAVVNFSSDIVDEEGVQYINPFTGIEIGHRRIDRERSTKLREPEEEKLAIEDLLRGYTINNALGMGIAHKTGSLEAGKLANLCILSHNIFRVPEDSIRKIKVETVMFEGKSVKGSL